MNPKPLRVLLIEDSEDDALLLTRELRRSGYSAEVSRVETEPGLADCLKDGTWDVVIADYNLPEITVLDALSFLREKGIDVPFIVISGAIADEMAVDVLRAGAHDFIRKGSWARLAPAIEREVGEAANRRQRRRAEQAIQFLAEASKQLASSLDPVEIGQVATNLAVPFLGDWCAILIQQQPEVAPTIAVTSADSTESSTILAFAREHLVPMHRRATRPGKAVDPPVIYVPDLMAEDDPFTDLAPSDIDYLRERGARSYLSTPLVARNRVLGSLALVRTVSGQTLTVADRAIAVDLAQRIGLAIDNALLYTAERSARREAQILAERIARMQTITAKIAGAATIDEVTRTIVAAGTAAADADAGLVAMPTKQRDVAEIVAHSGYPAEVRSSFSGESRYFSLDIDAPIAEAFRAGRLVALASEAARSLRYPDSPTIGYQAVVTIPLRVENRTIGVLCLNFAAPREFHPDELQYLETLADQCAQALERARLYESERRAVRIRDEFLSVAAHELRTPLTALWLQAQLVERRFHRSNLPALTKEIDALRVISRQAARAAELINRLLDISRIEAGRLRLDRQWTDVAAMVERVAQLTAERATHHSVSTHADRPIFASIDALRIEQVLTNLIDNAIKYTPDDGRIDVEATYISSDTVAISVTDSGIGIPVEHRGKIFEQYYRVQDDSPHSGLGLGLYIHRQIVELHGGQIRAEFPDDRGSCFIVELPVGVEAGLDLVAIGEDRR